MVFEGVREVIANTPVYREEMTKITGLDGAEGGKPWERSLGEFLREAVAKSPDKVFLEIGGQDITYQECLRRSEQTRRRSRG